MISFVNFRPLGKSGGEDIAEGYLGCAEYIRRGAMWDGDLWWILGQDAEMFTRLGAAVGDFCDIICVCCV